MLAELQAFFDCLRSEERFNTQVLVVSATYMNTGFGRHALTAEGKPMNEDDPNQAKGLMPSYAAECIINALINRKTELILAPFTHRFAIFLRWLYPTLFFYVMYRRGLKDKSTKNK